VPSESEHECSYPTVFFEPDGSKEYSLWGMTILSSFEPNLFF
jgi:hypothetical protein